MKFWSVVVLLSCVLALCFAQESTCIDPSIDIDKTLPGTELLRNGGFEDPITSIWWSSDAEGFNINDYVGGSCGGHAASIDTFYTRAGCPRTNAGIYQQVLLRQTAPKRVFVTGYGKGVNVSGVPDVDFSLYVDVYFTDGTAHYGVFVPFPFTTPGFNYVNLTIDETKPIDNIFVNLVFRMHTGTAYFDQISVKEEVILVYPIGQNILADPSFEDCTRANWVQTGGATCQVQQCGNDRTRTGNGSLSLGPETQDNCFVLVSQLVYFNPPITNTLIFSAYVSINYALGASSSNYVSLTLSDNRFAIAITNLPFEPTDGFVKISVNLTASEPLHVIYAQLLLQGRAGGVAFDDASLVLN